MTLQEIIDSSDNIVFFGGAGVSTESGIPDFRSPDGLYNQKYKYPPETIISHSFYQRYPEEFYRFYKDKMLYPDAKPGITHLALAKLEKEGKLIALVYPDFENAGKENITQKNIEIQMEENRIALNKELPAYSQISQINIHYEEFEKTPKRSIKRYLYQ